MSVWMRELEQFCEKYGQTIDQLADSVGKNLSDIGQWVNDQNPELSDEQVNQVIAFLGCSQTDLRDLLNTVGECLTNQKSLKQSLFKVISDLHNYAPEQMIRAARSFAFHELEAENLLNQLTIAIFEDVQTDGGYYIPFFQSFCSELASDDDLRTSEEVLKSIRCLICASSACYFDPKSFSVSPTLNSLSIQLPDFEHIDDEQEKINLASLSFRIHSHHRKSPGEQLEVQLDLHSRNFRGGGANIQLPKLKDTELDELFNEFCVDLARHIMVVEKAPSPRRENETANEAITRLKTENANFKIAILKKIKSLQTRTKHLRRSCKHPLAFSYDGDSDALIKRIEKEFPTLPIYQFKQDGMSCFSTGINIIEFSEFVKLQVEEYVQLVEGDLAEQPLNVRVMLQQYMAELSKTSEDYKKANKILEFFSNEKNDQAMKDIVDKIGKGVGTATKAGEGILAWRNVVEKLFDAIS